MQRIALIILGWVSLMTGTIGIFLPILPTVPLWLLSAWCFSKSSERLHRWLLSHRRFGPVIQLWQRDQAIPRPVKYRAIAMIWLALCVSMVIVGKLWLCLLLTVTGTSVTIYLLRLPTAVEPVSEKC